MSLLRIDSLHKYFGGLHAVNDVSFSLDEHMIKAVIGPNGAGKTTLFNLISGKIPASSGKVYYKDNLITGYKPFQVARMGIFRTFQSIQLNLHMTVLENVMIGRHIRTKAGFVPALLNLPWTWKEEKAIAKKSLEMLDELSIAYLKDEKVGNLPFGKQRSVEFARALAAQPELLLLDEPASGLNIYETAELSELIVKIKNRGITILLVEHDMSLVMDISDEIVVLNFGEKIAEGIPTDIQKNEEVIKIYLGEDDA